MKIEIIYPENHSEVVEAVLQGKCVKYDKRKHLLDHIDQTTDEVFVFMEVPLKALPKIIPQCNSLYKKVILCLEKNEE